MNQRLHKTIRLWIWLAALLLAPGAWAQVVISQVYGGGGNTGSTYRNDFIELHNRGTSPVTITGWTVQYAAAANASWASTSLTGTIPAGGYYLVQEAVGAGGTINLPTADAVGTLALSGTAGKVALVSNATLLTVACPTGATIIDFVGFGTTANCFEGTGPTPAPSNTTAVLRAANGCTDTNQNATDFTSGAPNPRNSASPIVTCGPATPVATLTASPTALTGFAATQGTVSNVQTYTLSGSTLNGNPVSVSATTNVELSTDNSTFSPTLSIPATTSAVSQVIYARLTNAALTGAFSGTITNTANTTLTASVTLSGQVNAVNAPALSATPTTLSGFSTPQGTISSEQTYTLTAANLTAGISVSAPAGIEVSQTTGAGFGSSVTFPQSTSSAVVYVHLTGTSVGSVSGTITNVSGSLTANVTASGAVSSTAPYTLISQIQGTGTAFNPAFGGTQTVEGIVTRTFFGATRLSGFYLQEEDADSDNNPATSEGIFIYDPSGLFAGNVGDKVRVTGSVSEFSGATASLSQITLASFVAVSTGNALPIIPNVQLPVANVSDLERYEGMLVNMSAASGNLAVTEYFQLGRFGQVLLSSTGATDQPGTDPRLDQYTQFFAPSVSGYAAYLAETDKRQIYLDDGSTVQNPATIIFGRGGQPLSASNTLRGGDQVSSITAVLDERLEGYRLQTTTGVNFQPTNARPTTPPVVGGTLKAGSFNVLNYFNTLGTGNFVTCSGNSIQVRGAENAAEFTRQRDKIIQAIVTSGVDVMGLNEMQNNGFGSNSAIQDLVNGLNAVAGANSFTYVNSGCISTDAITVAMIYKPARVTPVGSSTAIPFNYGTGSFTSVGRRALAQTFQQNSNGAVFTLVANHWKSKGSGSGAGDTDAGDGQSASNGTRTRQAQDLVSWLATKPTGTTDPDYLIVGDLNAYAQENPLTTLYSAGYTNLVSNTTYSYVFDGFVGALDHALRSASLQSQIAGADKWHINSDEPVILDYNTNFKTSDQITSLYSAEPYRASDHDPVIIGLNLVGVATPVALSITVTANPTTLLTTGTTTLLATVSGGTTPYTYTFSGPGVITATTNTASVSGLAAGIQTFTVVATDATTPTSQSISATVSVTVTQANQAPVVANTIPAQSATVNQAFSYVIPANTFSDPNNDALTLSVSGLPAGLSFTAPATISGTPSVSGTSTVTVTATDPGNLSASTSFSLNVSPAPVIPAITVVPSSLNSFSYTTQSAGSSAQSYTITATGLTTVLTITPPSPYLVSLDNFTFSQTLAIPAVNGTVSPTRVYVILAAQSAGTYNGLITNTSGPASATVSVTGTVLQATLTTNPTVLSNFTTTVGTPSAVQTYTVTTLNQTGISVVAPSGVQIRTGSNPFSSSLSIGYSYSTVSIPVDVRLSGVAPGPVTGTITHQSAYGNVDLSATVTINGLVNQVTPVNQAPVVANVIAPQSATVGQAFTYMIPANTFSDPNNDVLTLSVSGLPAGLNFTAPATISGTPSVSGTSTVTVTATDPENLSASTTFTITVSPATSMTSAAPFSITGVTAVSCSTISAGQRVLSFTPQYAGLNGSPVSFSVVNELAPTTQPGPYTLTLYTDNPMITLYAAQSGVVSTFGYNWLAACGGGIPPVNQAPVVANPIPNQAATVGQAFSYAIPANTFSDPNNDVLTLSVVGLPAGLNFTAPATISGTPSMSGTSTVTVTATDPGNLSASTSFSLNVSPASSMTMTGPFSITGVTTVSCATVSAGQRSISFTPQYAGVNGSPISFSVVNELAATTAAGPYTLRLYTDNPMITLYAAQSGVVSTFGYNWLAACGGGTPPVNQAPVVANPIPNQAATVGQGFSYAIPMGTFSDPNNDALTLSVSGLPAGLSFTAPATISGTPSMSGTSTVTVTATDPGNLSASTSFSLNVSPASSMTMTGPFSITGVTAVSCATVSAGQRSISFTPQYAGVNGSPISFSVVNELAATTAAGPYTLRLYTDNPMITLYATQSGVVSTFGYNWLAACGSGSTRINYSAESPLNLQINGNPVQNGQLSVEVHGATNESLHLDLMDMRGQVISTHAIDQAGSVERHTFDIGRLSPGLLLLRATTPTQSQMTKVIKAN